MSADIGAKLVRALHRKACATGDWEATSEPWHGGIFSGERHLVTLRFEGSAAVASARRLLNRLEDHEFSLPGVIVADIGLAGAFARRGCRSLTIEALVIDEA